MIASLLQLIFAWLPSWFAVFLLAIAAMMFVLSVFKVVGFVLDVVPFL